MFWRKFESITGQPNVYFHQDDPPKLKKTDPQKIPFVIDLSYDRHQLDRVDLITRNHYFRDCKNMLVGFITVNVASISNTFRRVVTKNPTLTLPRIFNRIHG